jgi:Ca-activated chloride channel family protein
MRLLLPISVSLLLTWQAARAQTADDFFNGGAQLYISNNIPSALEKVEGGLKIYPDDQKLKKLEELLKQRQQQQNQQNQQNQSQQQKPEKQNQFGQKDSEQQKQSEQQKSSDGERNGEKSEDQNVERQRVASRQMTPEEAKRLLDAQKGDEQILQLKPKESRQNSNRPFKDW